MKSYYELRDRSVVSTSPEAAQIRVYATPDNAEKQELIRLTRTSIHTTWNPRSIRMRFRAQTLRRNTPTSSGNARTTFHSNRK